MQNILFIGIESLKYFSKEQNELERRNLFKANLRICISFTTHFICVGRWLEILIST